MGGRITWVSPGETKDTESTLSTAVAAVHEVQASYKATNDFRAPVDIGRDFVIEGKQVHIASLNVYPQSFGGSAAATSSNAGASSSFAAELTREIFELPDPPSGFTGRADELKAFQKLCEDERCVLSSRKSKGILRCSDITFGNVSLS